MGLTPVTRDAAPAGKKYPYVLFAAPPSGSEDYPGAVSILLLWQHEQQQLLNTAVCSLD